MKRKYKPILFLLVFFGVVNIGFGSFDFNSLPTIEITSESDKACVNCQSSYLLADSVDLTADVIVENDLFADFKPNWLSWPHNEYPQFAYWNLYRFVLRDSGNRNWVVQFLDPHIGEFDAWIIQPNKELKHIHRSGFRRNFSIRSTRHKNHVFPLAFRDSKEIVVLTRSKSPVVSSFQGHINDASRFTGYAVQEYYYLGLYYGILAILIVYSLSIFFFSKDTIYLYYVAYVMGCACISFNEDGIGFHMFWSSAPWLNDFLTEWAPFVFSTTFVAFGIKLLELKKYMPAGRNIIIAAYLISIVYYQVTNAPSIVSPLFLLPLLSVFVCAIYLSIKGNRSARFFVVGYLFILLSQAIYVLRIEGLMIQVPQPWEILVVYCFNIAAIMEVFILSLAMADRLKQASVSKQIAQIRVIDSLRANEQLKDRVNRELEDKVASRTVVLEQQAADLKAQSEEIQRMNDMLKGRNLKLQEERVMLKAMTFGDFKEAFPDDKTCIDYLVTVKWANGFKCAKCGNDGFADGRAVASRRCSKCSQEESATANTLLHGIHFSVQKAFYLTYLIMRNPNVSVTEIAKNGEISRPSATKFKKRIISAQQKLARSKSSGWDGLLLIKP